jgi:hypothetical protein
MVNADETEAVVAMVVVTEIVIVTTTGTTNINMSECASCRKNVLAAGREI